MITDLGVLSPDPGRSNELVLTAVHPGVQVGEVEAQTGWELMVSEELMTTSPPTDEELSLLRDLKARTERAHSR